jgi:hypothetical protein
MFNTFFALLNIPFRCSLRNPVGRISGEALQRSYWDWSTCSLAGEPGETVRGKAHRAVRVPH